MKKIYGILVGVLFCFLIFSCENGLSGNEDYTSDTTNISYRNKKGRSVSGGFDTGLYIDASMKNISAYDISLSDFEALCDGEYRCGSSVIKIDKKNHKFYLRNPRVSIRGKEYYNLYCESEYKLLAAGENLLYLCPISNENVLFRSGDINLKISEVSPFSFYVSFYGFGENRIEVSSYLNDEAVINGGTYWAVK